MTLRDYATTFGGREQLSVRAFANAMEIIPKTLIENAGGDPLDKIVELRSAHESGDRNAGISVDGEVRDMLALNVVDPLRVKLNAVESAMETANMILRIDDVIAASTETPDLAAKVQRCTEKRNGIDDCAWQSSFSLFEATNRECGSGLRSTTQWLPGR